MRWAAALLLGCAAGAGASDAGEYLLHAAGCITCHTAEDGTPLTGGRAFETPYGTFFSPNITPDPQTGIGGWTRAQFVAALKHGLAPDGAAYFPVFPYPSYRLISDADAGRLYDHLMSLPAQRQPNREHDLPWWLGRWMMKPWQWWVLEPPPAPPEAPELARGWYLVDALGHCGECHTPRKFAGVSDRGRYLAGARDGPDSEAVPNITPHREDGIGKWAAEDTDYFLETGELPNGDYTGSLMADVIDNTTSRLTTADRRAVRRYLMSVPALPGP